jgi:hypothetical protein
LLKRATGHTRWQTSYYAGAEARDPDLKQYPISDLHAARLIFRAIGIDFKATGKPTGQHFCEMLVQCCEGAL